MPVTNYNSFPVAVLVFKSREIFKCRMCHLGSRANCLPAPPSSLKPGFAVEFDAVTGLLAISLHCFPHVPSPLRIWLQGINLETSIGSEDRFASLSTVLWVMGSPWIRGPQALHFTQVFFHGPHGCHGLCIHERHESRVENPRTTPGQRKCSNNTWTCLKIGCSRPFFWLIINYPIKMAIWQAYHSFRHTHLSIFFRVELPLRQCSVKAEPLSLCNSTGRNPCSLVLQLSGHIPHEKSESLQRRVLLTGLARCWR